MLTVGLPHVLITFIFDDVVCFLCVNISRGNAEKGWNVGVLYQLLMGLGPLSDLIICTAVQIDGAFRTIEACLKTEGKAAGYVIS